MNLDIPIRFKEGVRGLLLLHRNKDGQSGNAQRKCIKRISQSPEEWQEIVGELKAIRDASHLPLRIYASVNSRDMEKAIHEFKRRQLENDRCLREERFSFYSDMKNRFFSCLMNPSARQQSLFLIDCDTPIEYEDAKKNLHPALIIWEYPTKNGHHIITHAFNPNLIPVCVKKDDLLYIP